MGWISFKHLQPHVHMNDPAEKYFRKGNIGQICAPSVHGASQIDEVLVEKEKNVKDVVELCISTIIETNGYPDPSFPLSHVRTWVSNEQLQCEGCNISSKIRQKPVFGKSSPVSK